MARVRVGVSQLLAVDNEGLRNSAHNVAKTLIEFSTSIPRHTLLPVHLRTTKSCFIPHQRDQGGHSRGKSRTNKEESSGGAYDV